MVQDRISQIFNNTGTNKIKDFSKIFNVSNDTIGEWISDIRTKQRGTRDSLIYKLHALGWQGKEIADVVSVDPGTVTHIIENFRNLKNSILQDSKTKSVEELATYHGLNLQTAWAVILQDKPDIEKFGKLNIKLKVYDVWNYSECHNLLGQEHDGRIPGQ